MIRTAVAATQAAAAKAEEAADALLAWLQAQPKGIDSQPGATGRAGEESAPVAKPSVAALHEGVAEPHTHVPGTSSSEDTARDSGVSLTLPPEPAGRGRPALRLPHTDWLHHRLLITGPTADLAAFRAAAAGAGIVPWQIDFDRMEEDLFHLLVAPPARAGALGSRGRSLSLAGARILAGQLRAAAARRHTLAVARVGHSAACPFDLHALVPVPDAIMQYGPDEPAALDWLWAHWGTTQVLRHVVEDEAVVGVMAVRRPAAPGEATWALTFWSADWTPWRALAEIAGRWPALRFETRPMYDMA
jgi:hypothetical protein